MINTPKNISERLAALYHTVNDAQRKATPKDYQNTMLPLLLEAYNASMQHNYAAAKTKLEEAQTFSAAYPPEGGERSPFRAELSVINYELGDLLVPLSAPAEYLSSASGRTTSRV